MLFVMLEKGVCVWDFECAHGFGSLLFSRAVAFWCTGVRVLCRS
jgi:hypothetical protein